MIWILMVVVTALTYSISGFFDNYTVDTFCRKLNPKCMSIFYAAMEAMVCLGLFIWRGTELFQGIDITAIGIFAAAALMSVIGSVPYFFALRKDTTTENTLLWQIEPVMALVFAAILLGQMISFMQIIAFVLIIGATVLIILGSDRKRFRFRLDAGLLVLVSCVFYVLADTIFVFQARGLSIWTSIFWVMLSGVVINSLAILIIKSWRRDFKAFWKQDRPKKFASLFFNETIYLIGRFVERFGMLIMPLAIWKVTENILQLILTFILGIVFTLIWPKFGREKLSKKNIFHHALATGLVTVAIVLMG
ncbi:DMT family transporter [Candidatus Saccharibacteria bacterium]|nr:DMT family transporter [Candidatus Saccharibacteria bacterium]MCL1963079.1 DMT family transporter [Candidatus Saccharibacteria bacterium]